MKTILYIHGFASSGASGTPQMLRQQLYEQGVRVLSPDVPTMPTEALPFLRRFVESERPDLIVGTSMGAFYAEQLRGTLRILINPSFHMARLLTFRGMGRCEFLNRRADGAKDFKIDRAMIDAFRAIERNAFRDITPADRRLVWGLFADKDESVDHRADFLRHYGRERFVEFAGGHRLNDRTLNHVVVPLVERLLSLPPRTR